MCQILYIDIYREGTTTILQKLTILYKIGGITDRFFNEYESRKEYSTIFHDILVKKKPL